MSSKDWVDWEEAENRLRNRVRLQFHSRAFLEGQAKLRKKREEDREKAQAKLKPVNPVKKTE